MPSRRVDVLVGHVPNENESVALPIINGFGIIAEHFEEIGSTQSFLHDEKLPELIQLQDPGKIFVASADHQTAVPDSLMSRSPFITQILALSAVEVLESMNITDLSIKWPNDIMLKGCKVGGILAQLCSSSAMIIGIGLNINTSVSVLEGLLVGSENNWPPASIYEIDAVTLRSQLISTFTSSLAVFFSDKTDIFLVSVSGRQYKFKERISFRAGPKIWQGVHNGLDKSGGLILYCDDGESRVFYSGEIV